MHCMKVFHIGGFSGPYFLAFRLSISPYSVRIRENMDQKNSEYGQFLRSDKWLIYVQFGSNGN